MYLTSDAWKNGFADDTKRYGDDDGARGMSYDTYVNTANWGARPADRPDNKRAPSIQCKKQYKLFFGEHKEGLKITKDSKVMEAHYHEVGTLMKHKFVTLVYHKAGAFTFKIRNSRNLEKPARYEGQYDNTTFTADIVFQEQGTEFTGSGKDKNAKEFTITGKVDPEGKVKKEGNHVSGFIINEKEQYDLEFGGFNYDKEGAITLTGQQKITGFDEID
jgi:hypothetical protein